MMTSMDTLYATLQAAFDQVDRELRQVSLSMFDRPELAWEEHHAHRVLTDWMSKQAGFTVTRHAYGIRTAWSAVYCDSNSGPCIGFNSEMDALPGPTHSCGHPLIAIAGCAAAVAVARTMKEHQIPGKVVLLGTPAEESGGGKQVLLNRGAYDEMDACLMVHPGPGGSLGATPMTSTCLAAVTVEYKGKSAHAGGAPEKGVNALDAAVLGYNNISALRQQVPGSHRIHGIIAGGEGWSVNAIPAVAQLKYGMRAPSATELAALIPRVMDCFKAAALATGTTFTTHRQQVYLDLQPIQGLADEFKRYTEDRWQKENYQVTETPRSSASTDFGNVSYRLPTLHPSFWLPEASSDEFPHSDSFRDASKTESAHGAALKAAEGIAAVGLKFVVDKAFRDCVREQWLDRMDEIDGHLVMSKINDVLPASEGPVKGTFCACGERE